jgi:hypothetical protein
LYSAVSLTGLGFTACARKMRAAAAVPLQISVLALAVHGVILLFFIIYD